jgi:molybdate transport system substrate-binding protein
MALLPLRFRRVFVLFLVTAFVFGMPRLARADDVLVFAAASLKNSLDDAVAAWSQHGGSKINVSYGASSALAKQLESGAPADLFISADLDWMNDVQNHNGIQTASRINLLGNVLVMIAPADNKTNIDIKPGFPLAQLLGDNHLAMADPDAVPAGKYGKAALQKLGVWDSVEGKVARAEDVRAALSFVSRKEAPLGIVYQTDAAADKGVRVAGTFPPDTYPPIIYPIALTAQTKNADAAKFLTFLRSEEARPFFEKQGFAILK